jgi:hypothetical protein
MMMEGVWPELGIKMSASQETADRVAKGLMGAFNGAILVRAVCASRVVLVAKALERVQILGLR